MKDKRSSRVERERQSWEKLDGATAKKMPTIGSQIVKQIVRGHAPRYSELLRAFENAESRVAPKEGFAGR